jgi:glycosyltransferase involved in cell wall biosynthesis
VASVGFFYMGKAIQCFLVTLRLVDEIMAQVSVLMSTYNENPSFLDKSINSILGQSYTDFEFIIIDDGSTDLGTLDKLAEICSSDRRIVLKHCEHKGLTKSLNIGLGTARGEYIARQDSDDWSHPDRLKLQVDYLNSHQNYVLLGCNFFICNRSGDSVRTAYRNYDKIEIPKAMQKNNVLCHGSVMFKKDAATSLGGYREFLLASQDYDLFLRMAEKYPVAVLKDTLYYHRRGGGTISAEKAEIQAESKWIIRRMAKLRRRGLPEDLNVILQNAKTGSARRNILTEAFNCLRAYYSSAGDTSTALKLSLQTWLRNPYSFNAFFGILKSLLQRNSR